MPGPGSTTLSRIDKERLDVLAGTGRGEAGARAVRLSELQAVVAQIQAIDARLTLIEQTLRDILTR